MNADDASVIQAAYGSLLSLGISLDKYTLAATDQNVPLFYGLPATTAPAPAARKKTTTLYPSVGTPKTLSKDLRSPFSQPSLWSA